MVRLLTLSGLILLLAAPTASAGVREKILRECQEGRITGDYTPGQLRDARKNIPTDIDEYSDCRDVLARAALAGRSSGGTAAAAAVPPRPPAACRPAAPTRSPTPPTRARSRTSPRRCRTRRRAPRSAATHIVPGASGLAVDAARHGLPTTLLTVLILLGLCALPPPPRPCADVSSLAGSLSAGPRARTRAIARAAPERPRR